MIGQTNKQTTDRQTEIKTLDIYKLFLNPINLKTTKPIETTFLRQIKPASNQIFFNIKTYKGKKMVNLNKCLIHRYEEYPPNLRRRKFSDGQTFWEFKNI